MANMKYLLNCISFIFLMVLFSFFDNFGTDEESEENKYDYLFNVVFVGDAGVGKTQIVRRYVNNCFDEVYKNTLCPEFFIKIIGLEDKTIRLKLWDTAGQKMYKTITQDYFKRSHLIVLVYAISDKKSFENIQNWVDDAKKQIDQKFKFLLVGNKFDLEGQRLVTKEEAEEYAKNNNNMKFIEVSAKTGVCIKNMFKYIIQELLDDMEKEKQEKLPSSYQDKDIFKIEKTSFCDKYCSCCPCS